MTASGRRGGGASGGPEPLQGETAPGPAEDAGVYRAILHTALDGCVMLDRVGCVVDANDAYARMSGYSKRELLDLTVNELDAADSPAEVAERMRAAMRQGSVRFESFHRRRDGSVYPVEVSSQILPVPQAGCLVFVRDLSEAKRAEAALRASETRFRLFMDRLPGLAYIKDEQLRVIFASQGFARHLDMPPDGLIGKRNEDLFPAAFARSLTADDQRVLGSGYPIEVEEVFGGRVWVTRKFPIPREDGPPLLGGLTVDITARREAERRHAARALEVESLFEANRDLLCVTDGEGRLRRVNPTWEAALGYRRAEAEGRSLADFIHPDDRQACLAAIYGRSAQAQAIDFQARGRRRDGSYRWLEWRAFHSGDVVFAQARDVTERRDRDEAQLRDAWLQGEAQRIGHVGAYNLDLASGTWTSTAVLDEILGIQGRSDYPRDVSGWLRFVHPDDRGAPAMVHAASGGDGPRTFDHEYRLYRANDGGERWVHERARLIPDGADRPSGLVGVIRDVTEERSEARR